MPTEALLSQASRLSFRRVNSPPFRLSGYLPAKGHSGANPRVVRASSLPTESLADGAPQSKVRPRRAMAALGPRMRHRTEPAPAPASRTSHQERPHQRMITRLCRAVGRRRGVCKSLVPYYAGQFDQFWLRRLNER